MWILGLKGVFFNRHVVGFLDSRICCITETLLPSHADASFFTLLTSNTVLLSLHNINVVDISTLFQNSINYNCWNVK